MVLGFGKTEIDTAISIMGACASEFNENMEHNKNVLDRIQKKYKGLEEKYSELPQEKAPERYSYFYWTYYELYPNNFVVKFRFSHINRRHALSPDGWAMLQTTWIFSRNEFDGDKIYKEI